MNNSRLQFNDLWMSGSNQFSNQFIRPNPVIGQQGRMQQIISIPNINYSSTNFPPPINNQLLASNIPKQPMNGMVLRSLSNRGGSLFGSIPNYGQNKIDPLYLMPFPQINSITNHITRSKMNLIRSYGNQGSTTLNSNPLISLEQHLPKRKSTNSNQIQSDYG